MKKLVWSYCVPLLLLFQEINFSNGENESEFSSTDFGSCALHCREQNVPQKLMYEVGKKYLYNFTTQVHIWNVKGYSDVVDFDGNDDIETDDKEWFKVEGEAAVLALNSCEHILTVNYINIIKKTRQKIKVSQEHPNLRFALEDGQIGKICLHRNDTVSSGNIKKAIISMLQTSLSNQENFSEADISGVCPTIYETMENGSVMKTKDLNKCKNRDELSFIAYGIPSSDDSYNAVYFMNSTSKCTQMIKTNIVEQAECKEIHDLNFDNANILIRSSIQLVSADDNSETDQNDKKEFILSSLVFSEKQNSLKYNNALSAKMENITDELCRAFKSNTVTAELAKSAYEFLEIIGKMETIEDLEALKKKIFSRNCAEEIAYKIKYLYDIALAKSPNQATIEYFANSLLQNPEIIEQFLPDFISNIGWSQNMKIRDNLISLLKLMDFEFPSTGNLKRNFILAAAQAIHKYSSNVANFRNDNLIMSLLQKTEENTNVLDFLEQIKVLENLPQISKSKSEEFDCLNWPTRNTTKTESLYCVYAFQSDACNPVWKTKIRNILKQSQAESDIKIQAYLSAWKCLDLNDVATIESLFEDLNSNSDVLGFITSHLQNMVKNGNSLMENNKILVDKLSTMIETIKENQTRQLSKNYAWVYFNKEEAVRVVHLDVNVLFSSRSYIPSFVNGNLTVEIRGRSYNILEVGIASDQIQALIDKYIAPKKSAVVVREEILIFVRILGATIYSDKISAENLDNSIFSPAIHLLRSKSYAKMLPFLFDDKIIDVFQYFKHFNEDILVPTVAGCPIKVNFQASTLAALKLQSKGLLQWNPFRNSTFTSKFAPSFVRTLSNSVTVEMEEYHGIGFSNEEVISSAADLTLSSLAVVDGEPTVKMQLDFPIEGLEIFKLDDRKSFWIEKDKFSTKRRYLRPNTINDWPGEFHECTDFLPTVFALKICETYESYFGYGKRNTLWIGAVEDDENQTKKIIALDLTWNLKENEKSFDFRLHSPSTVNTVSLNSLKANVNYTSSFSSREVTLNVSTPWMTSEITVFGDYNVTWQGILTSFSYNGRKYSGEAYQKVSSPLNLPGDYPQIRLSFLDVFFCSLLTHGCDIKYETIVQFSHPYSEKSIQVFDAMVEKADEYLINFHVKTGNVFKMAEGSLEGKFRQSNDVAHLNSSDSEDAQVFLLDIDITSVALGKLQLNNSYKSYGNNDEAIARVDVNGNYGRFNDEKLHTFHFEVVGNASVSMHPGKIDSAVGKLRTSQSPFLDSDFIWKIHYLQNSSSVYKQMFLLLPLQLPSYEFQFTILDAKWKWLTYKSFDVSEIFSVSMPKQEWEIFLRFVSMKNTELHTMDLALDVQKKKDKYSNSLFYDSRTQILKAAIISPKVSYDFKRIISVETSESGSTKESEKYVVSKSPGNIDLVSCMYTKERGKSDVALKYKDEKYFQFSYEDKAEEFQKNNAIFIKDYIDGKILMKTNSDGSIWPIMIQIDSKWIPSKYIITGTILATPEGSNIKLDTDIDWNLIGEENSPSIGKISGMTHVGLRTYELTSLLKINQKGEQDCFLRTNAKLIDESGNSVWKPHVDIIMKNSDDESLFDISYLFELLNNKKTGIPSFHMQLKGMRFNTSSFNFNTECSTNETETETATYAFFKAALDIEHKNNFIYKLPVDLDFHLNADWSHDENYTELIGKNIFQHLKVKAASDSGVLPQKWYTWQYTYDVHPSYNPSDFDNKTKNVLVHLINGESILEQSNGFKRTANCNLIARAVPTRYTNYTCNEYCTTAREHSDNTVFYGVAFKRTLQFLYFIREEYHDYEHTYLNGTSQFSWLIEYKWTNIQFMQDHTILMPAVSPVEESWITMFEFSANETETKLNFGQPGLLEIKGILNEYVAKLSSSVDVTDYETSLKFNLDRNISPDNFQFEISAQSPFERLNNLSFRIDHMLHMQTRTTYPMYKMIVLGRANKDLYESELRWMTKIPGHPFITLIFLEASIQNVDSEWASHYVDFQLTEMGLHGTIAPSRVFVLQSQYRVATDSYFTASGICSPLEFSCDLRFYVPDKADWALAIKQNKEDTPMYQVAIYKELDTFLQLKVDVDYYGQDAKTGIWKLSSNATLEGQGLHIIADEIKGRLNAKTRFISPIESSEDLKREIEIDGSIVFIKEPDSAFPNSSLFQSTYHLFTKFSNFDKATSFKLCTLSKNTNQTKHCIITI